MTAVRQFIKQWLAAALYYSGALWLYARVLLSNRIVVLTYHRVLPADRQRHSFSSPAIVVTPATFAMHVATARRWFHLLSEDELLVALRTHAAPPRSCVITFDDGWYDNHAYALAVLSEQSTPMLLFVATDYIGTDGCFWQERLAALLFAARAHEAATRSILESVGAGDIYRLSEAQARTAARAAVHRIKNAKLEPSALIDRLTSAMSDDEPSASEDRFMSVDQLRELQAHGISIGSHAMSHSRLNLVGEEQMRRELGESRQVIEQWCGHRPRTLAYPNGDYDERVVAASREAGYEAAFTTDIGHNPPGIDPLRIKRINMHEAAAATRPMFLCRALGLL